jgi:hypothetical protein
MMRVTTLGILYEILDRKLGIIAEESHSATDLI